MYKSLMVLILLFLIAAVLAVACLIDGAKKTGLVLCLASIGVAVFALTLVDKLPINQEVTEVTAIVSDKEYKEESSRLIPIRVGKITSYNKRNYPEEYLVTVYYNGITDIINNQELYNAVEEGNAVKVFLKTEYNNKQEILNQEFLFE